MKYARIAVAAAVVATAVLNGDVASTVATACAGWMAVILLEAGDKTGSSPFGKFAIATLLTGWVAMADTVWVAAKVNWLFLSAVGHTGSSGAATATRAALEYAEHAQASGLAPWSASLPWPMAAAMAALMLGTLTLRFVQRSEPQKARTS